MRGLLAMHVSGGGVRENPESLRTGPYADGETWLALARYHDTFPDHADAARALTELEEYALDYYRRNPDTSFYRWGAQSAAARLARGDAARLADFTAAQAEFILREVPPEKKEGDTSCAQVEGLGSAVSVLRSRPGREDLVARLEQRIALELTRNRALQIAPGQDRLALGGGGELRAPSLAGSAGAFRSGRYRAFTRTDLTQHCISAFLIANRLGLANATQRRD